MSSLPFVNMVLQQTPADCAIAALAMYLGLSYADVFAASITPTYRDPHVRGMEPKHIVAAAKRLKTRLVVRRTWDLEESCGLLTVESADTNPETFLRHLVLLKFGLVFETDGTVWAPDDYFRCQGYRPVSILVEEEGEV